jgi:lipid II:glycine glycyltransferase (peptidoglycan interpeptide bridge formation enzyme)
MMTSSEYTCRLVANLDSAEVERFDRFVRTAPHTVYSQTATGAAAARTSRLQHFRYLCCEDRQSLSLTGVVRFTRLAPSRYLATMSRGPIFTDPDVLDRCLPQVISKLKGAGACTILMNPRWEGTGAQLVEEILIRHGFAALPEDEQTVHAVTGMVDLTRSEEAILAGFKQRCRRQIRKAERMGLVVRPAQSEDDARRFEPLFENFSRRKGFDIAGLPKVADQWRLAQDRGVFLLAEVGGKLVGAHVALQEGSRGFWLVLASDDDQADVPRGYTLLWEGMRHMKQRGCTVFDLAGMADGEVTDSGEANRMQFKSAFDPEPVKLVRIHSRGIMPVSHAILFRARQAYRRSGLRRHLAPFLQR